MGMVGGSREIFNFCLESHRSCHCICYHLCSPVRQIHTVATGGQAFCPRLALVKPGLIRSPSVHIVPVAVVRRLVMVVVVVMSLVSVVSMVFFYVHCSVSSTMMSIMMESIMNTMNAA